jgi:membrane-associated phospholipid phosphatase
MLCLGDVSAAFAQSMIGRVLHTVATDFRHVATVGNAVIVGGSAATAAVFAPYDRRVMHLSRDVHGMDDEFNYAKPLGHGVVQIGGAATLLLAGRLAGRPSVADLGGELLRAQAINGAITQAVKFTVRRSRPDGGPRSLPSGHTSAAFATATVLGRRFGWKVGGPASLVAGVIATTRVAANEHYVSDLIVGAGIGVVAGRAIRFGSDRRSGISLSPLVSRTAAGVSVAWTPRL